MTTEHYPALVYNDRTAAIMAKIIELITNLDLSDERDDEDGETKTAHARAVN